eukprot:3025702-Prymnesium_polylepis.1
MPHARASLAGTNSAPILEAQQGSSAADSVEDHTSSCSCCSHFGVAAPQELEGAVALARHLFELAVGLKHPVPAAREGDRCLFVWVCQTR